MWPQGVRHEKGKLFLGRVRILSSVKSSNPVNPDSKADVRGKFQL
jgi:hypothetical protein